MADYTENQHSQNQYSQNQYTQNQNVQNFERYNSDGSKKKEKKNGKKGKAFGISFGFLVLIALFVLANSMVVTKQNQFKLIRQFGRVDRVVSVPGLSFKVPFIESVDTVPKELLLYDLPASDVITSDKKTMIVDSYVLWRVTDPLKFAQTLSCSVQNAESRIDAIVYNATKNTISNMKQDEVIRSRDGKMTITVDETGDGLSGNDLDLSGSKEEVIEITSLTEEVMGQINHVEDQYGAAELR